MAIQLTGLYAHWTMDNIDGTTLIDEMGNLNGTIHGAISVPGFHGNALSFNGNGDHISFAPGALDGLTGDFVILVRYKPVGTDNVLISKYSAIPAFFELIGRDDSGYLNSQLGEGGGNVQVKGPAVGEGWSHAGLRMSGTVATLFLDGAGVASKTVTRNTSRATDSLYIGRRGYPGAEAYFEGLIDSILIYNLALSDTEIEDVYLTDDSPEPYEVRGSVTVDLSPGITEVRIYNAGTGELLKTSTCDAGGNYAISLTNGTQVYAVAVPPAGYRPLIHGPINPTLRT
ncbi:Concanavalin A-like lectin/glucanases superfamily protein [Amphritea atlantica]|uniref:Concanavalin A-like lectin/glucanases superfamily protein n=1 Tax=Amphritea atlantica TaxID=355243 RepID=A0A1H9EGE3_9GAMM|nr:LamG domain-containing protein [Amphritea atlantica]SEQ24826.1 Concanavalin A-like lectin/glucanases superfamily protein [Amphritea atlantica]